MQCNKEKERTYPIGDLEVAQSATYTDATDASVFRKVAQ